MSMLTGPQINPSTPREVFHPVEKPPLTKLRDEAGMRIAGRGAAILHALAGTRAGNTLGILTYHRVAPNIPGLPKPLHNVTPSAFREQLSGLLERGYSAWPLAHVMAHRARGQTLPPKTIVVTFDDGFETLYTNAWPVLCDLGIPATAFISTAYLDSDDPFPFDAWGLAHQRTAPIQTYRPLKNTQCRELVDEGLVEFGAHTHTHQDFRDRPREFRRDLLTSVDLVQSRFGVHEVPFAFPFGSPHLGFADPRLVEAAKETSVTCGLTTQAALVDLQSDPFTWGRFNVFDWDTAATLAGKLGGWYDWAPKLKQKVIGP